MSDDIFETAALNESLQAASDEALIEEVARRMLAPSGFYEKTCDHKGLIEACERAHWRMEAAAHRMKIAA